jgi:predicted NBD/HSP70 family sugar kinase
LALVADLEGRVIATVEEPFDFAGGLENGLPPIVASMQRALTQAGIERSQLMGVGLGVPAYPNHADEINAGPGAAGAWDVAALQSRLNQTFAVPVYLNDTTSLGALGEWFFGAGQGTANLAYLKIDTLISRAVVFGGQVTSTRDFGHTVIDQNGLPCRCGKTGCLEAMASGPAIVQRALLAIQAGRPTSLKESVAREGNLTLQAVIEAVAEGDALSCQLFQDAGRLLGLAVADIVTALYPLQIIIGGKLALANGLILKSMRETVSQHLSAVASGRIDIVQAALGPCSSALGAAALALQGVFPSPMGYPEPDKKEVRYHDIAQSRSIPINVQHAL